MSKIDSLGDFVARLTSFTVWLYGHRQAMYKPAVVL
jgi:hypothetical protein